MTVRTLLRREAPALGLAASVIGHVLVARAIPSSAPPTVAREPAFVDLEPLPAPPPPPLPLPAEPAPTPPAPEMAGVQLQPRHRAAPPGPRPAATAPPEAAAPTKPAAPLALTGVTLSGDDAAWSTTAGNGERMTGPIGAARGAPTATDRGSTPSAPRPAPRPVTRAPREVALGDLSEKPRAPNLNGALRRLYPSTAREQQVSGHAAVRARIGPSGTVTSTRLVSESFAGFGAACQAALRSSKWSTPRDARGRAVATWILYRCNFQLAN
jgi:outer membrane biosynthesis protein TonB